MKPWIRTISLVLSFVMLMQSLPLTALASQLPEPEEEITETLVSQELTVQPESVQEEPDAQTEEILTESVSGEDSGFSWVLEDGVLTVSGTGEMPWDWSRVPWYDYKAQITSVVIGEGITRVCNNAFTQCTALTQVDFGPDCRELGEYVFVGCTALTEISIPQEVTLLPTNLFRNCSALARVEIPDGLTNVDSGVFENCSSLTSISLPDTVTYMGSNVFAGSGLESFRVPSQIQTISHRTFKGAAALKRVSLPAGLLRINPEAFSGCAALEEIHLPESLEYIDTDAFYGCTGLTEITIPAKTGLASDYYAGSAFEDCINLEKVVFSDGAHTAGGFMGCSALREVILPDSIEEISDGAFSGCASLAEIQLPEGIQTIRDFAFNGTAITQIDFPAGIKRVCGFESCTGLTQITIPEGVTHIGSFYGCVNLESIEIPETVIAIGGFQHCSSLKEIDLPEGITSMAHGYTFADCGNLRKIDLPDSLTSISYCDFSGCVSLEEVTIPDSVTRIRYRAFENCAALETLQLSSNLEKMEEYAFSGCTALKSLELPVSLKEIDEYVFENCTSLEQLILPEGLELLGSNMFRNATALTEVTIPSTLTGGSASFYGSGLERVVFAEGIATIPGSLLTGCKELREISLPDSVTVIGYNAFANLPGLVSIELPESLREIGDYAFDGCTNLLNLTIPQSVTTIGDYAFCRCYGLGNLEIPSGVTSIGREAFSNSGIQNAVIPGAVTALETSTFSYCEDLASVVVEEGVTSIGHTVFDQCENLRSVELPFTVTSIQATAFRGCPYLTIYTIPGSYAWSFAEEQGIPVQKTGQRTTLTVTDEAGNPLTEGFLVNWYEAGSDTVAATGTSVMLDLSGEMAYEYEIILHDPLCYQYQAPLRQSAGEDALIYVLNPLTALTIIGTVTDSENQPIADAQVDLLLIYGEGYTREVTVFTDGDGAFQAQTDNVAAQITISAQGYFSRTVDRDLSTKTQDTDLGGFVLNPLTGNRISLTITAREASVDGISGTETVVSPETLTYSVRNLTTGANITEFACETSGLILGKGQAAPGDQLEITAVDPEEAMTAESVTVTLDEQSNGSAVLLFVSRGCLEVGRIAGVDRATVMIFDEKGALQESRSVTGGFRTKNLQPGSYQAVFLADSDLITAVGSLQALQKLGLQERWDYESHFFTVYDGTVTTLDAVSVPKLDESRLSYCLPNSVSFASSDHIIYPGQNAMLRVSYEIDSKYVGSGQTLLVQLPEHLEITGISTSKETLSHTMDGNTARIVTNKSKGHIWIYVTGKEPGNYTLSAGLQMNLSGAAVTQPLGSLKIEVSPGEITVPEYTTHSSVSVQGSTLPKTVVRVYRNGELVGNTSSNSAGTWKMEIPLVRHYSRAGYEIYAEITDQDTGRIYQTEKKYVMYEPGRIELQTLTMVNTAQRGIVSTTFNFRQPHGELHYAAWPEKYPTFAFTVRFSGGDDTRIKNVRVNTQDSQGRNSSVGCSYNSKTGTWLGEGYFDTVQRLPVIISVSYDLVEQSDLMVEAERFLDLEAAGAEAEAELEELFQEAENVEDDTDYDALSIDELFDQVDTLTDQEEQCIAEFDRLVQQAASELAMELQSNGNSVTYTDSTSGRRSVTTITTVEPQSHEELLEEGYEPIQVSDGTMLYQKAEGDTLEYLDPVHGVGLISELDSGAQRRSSDGSIAARAQEAVSTMQAQISTIVSYCSSVEKLINRFIAPMKQQLRTARAVNGVRAMKLYNIRRKMEQTDEQWDLVEYARRADGLNRRMSQNSQKIALQKTTMSGWLRCAKYLKGMGVFSMALDAISISNHVSNLISLYKMADQCPESADAEALRSQINGLLLKVIGYVAGIAASYALTTTGLLGLIVGSGGTATVVAVAAWAGVVAALAVGLAKFDDYLNDEVTRLRELAKNMDCGEPEDEADNPNYRRCIPVLDPSGYVYEAVPSNRLEGVKAQIYSLEEGREVLWNAEDFDQANPLYTDAEGGYAWDVPVGRWLVRYSKDGYLDADSKDDPAADAEGYLPVPPPQMEVNVGMISTAAPEVESLNVYQDQIQVIFSQYMQPGSVRLTVTSGGKTVTGTLAAANPEYNEEETAQYATVFNFTPSVELSGNISVSISGAKNYAGTAMKQTFAQTKPVTLRPTALAVENEVKMGYGEDRVLQIRVLPAQAGANKVLTIQNLAPGIVDISSQSVTTDASGLAEITLTGTLPGSSEITITLEGTALTAKVSAQVSLEQLPVCQKVTASIPSGTELEPGTKLTLSTPTLGAKIYYTLDGTCPCVEDSPSRKAYTGPISIQEDTFLIAYAVKEGMEDSPTSGFLYTVKKECVHQFGPWTVTVPATGASDGEEQRGCRLCGFTETRTIDRLTHPFTDVAPGVYFEVPVLWAVEKGITSGTSDTTFSPFTIAQRCQVVTFLWRAEGCPEPSSNDNPFVDVNEDHYFYKAVLWAVENGITSGTSKTTFSPFAECERCQVVTFLWRAAECPEPQRSSNPFADVNESHYFYKAVLWAVENGITSGTDSTHFSPFHKCERCQIVTFLYRAQTA